MIEGREAVRRVHDYFADQIDQSEATDLVLRYFASVPIAATPTPRAWLTPTPTPRPTATPRSVPSTPIITSVAGGDGDGSFTVQWERVEEASLYQLSYRRERYESV